MSNGELVRTTRVTKRHTTPLANATDDRHTDQERSSPTDYYVFAFGDNSAGQLLKPGHPPVSEATPQCVSDKLRGRRIEQIACGEQNTYIISDQGNIWGGGSNEQGLLSSTSDDERVEQKAKVDFLCRLEKLENAKVKFVASGAEHSVVVYQSGNCVSYGTNEYGQLGHGVGTESIKCRGIGAVQRLPNQGEVCSVACGRYFTLFLTKEGEVYACGDNSQGCLGTADIDHCAVPRKIEALAGLPVSQIAAGESHCLAMTLSRCLFVWGRCKNGQLGIDMVEAERLKKVFIPRKIVLDRPVKNIAAGGEHSVILQGGGVISTCGQNASGQCGVDPGILQTKWNFTPVENLYPDSRWLMASAGHSHTVLVSAAGETITFGRNLEGQLGVGSLTPFEWCPQRVTLELPDTKDDEGVPFAYGCAAGAFHTLVAAVPVRVNPSLVNELFRQQSMAFQNPPTSPRPLNVVMPSLPLFRGASQVRPAKAAKRLKHSDETIRSLLNSTSIQSGESLQSLASRGCVSLPFERTRTLDLTVLHRLSLCPSTCTDKIGFSTAEAIDLLSRGNAAEVKAWLLPLFSSPVRLNCSFLIRNVVPELDVEGLFKFYDAVCAMGEVERSDILAIIVSGIDNCIEATKTGIAYYREDDQVRWIMIALSCPLFQESPISEPAGKCLSKLYALFSSMPCAGREVICDILIHGVHGSDFHDKFVKPARQHMEFVLNRNIGKPIPAVSELWDLILFMQICYEANEAEAAQVRVDEMSKRLPKIPREELKLDSATLKKVDVVAEWRVFTAYVEQDKNRSPDAPVPKIPAWKWTPQNALHVEGPIGVTHRYFMAHSNLLPITYKRDIFHVDAKAKQAKIQSSMIQMAILSGGGIINPVFHIVVSRENLIQDAMSQIFISHGAQLLKPLKVSFKGEEGVDEGGLKREFFRLAIEQLFAPQFGLFVYNEQTRTHWFSMSTMSDQEQEFGLAGMLIGLAIYNAILLDLKFPKVLYKKVLNQSLELSDLLEIDEAKVNGYAKLLSFDVEGDEQRALFNDLFGCLTFTETVDKFGLKEEIELKENGKDISVSPENRQEYIRLLVQFHLNKGVEKPFTQFQTGLFCLLNQDLLKAMSPDELQLLICGTTELNFQDLKEGARYEGGFTADDEYIKWLWDILDTFNGTQKKKFLLFCTGSDRVPAGGLRELRLLLQKNGSEPVDRLPTAYTCFNALLLPQYATPEKLSRMLSTAIEQSEGFGLS